MKNKIKAVIFDMDGLLIDSEVLQSKAYESVVLSYGKKPVITKTGLIHMAGIKAADNWPWLKEKHGIDEEISILVKKKRKEYLTLLQRNKIKSMPGLRKLLSLLNREGIKKAIASGSPVRHIKTVLNALKIEKEFDVITGADHISTGKPNPEVYIKALNFLRIKPQYCVALEDSETGVLSAKRAGLKVITVPNKFTKYQDFSKADKIVKSLSDITIKLLTNL